MRDTCIWTPDLWTPADAEEIEREQLKFAPWAGFDRPHFLKKHSLREIAMGLFTRELVLFHDAIMPAMGADVKIAYGTSGQTLTCTLASLASLGSRGAASVDNNAASVFFLDALVFFQISPGATVAAPNIAIIYGAGTVSDDGTPDYPDAYAGTDAGVTLDSPTNLRPLGVVQAPTANTGKRGGPWSLAALFGGAMPERWGVVVNNQTGGALHATEGNHLKLYQNVYNTVL